MQHFYRLNASIKRFAPCPRSLQKQINQKKTVVVTWISTRRTSCSLSDPGLTGSCAAHLFPLSPIFGYRLLTVPRLGSWPVLPGLSQTPHCVSFAVKHAAVSSLDRTWQYLLRQRKYCSVNGLEMHGQFCQSDISELFFLYGHIFLVVIAWKMSVAIVRGSLIGSRFCSGALLRNLFFGIFIGVGILLRPYENRRLAISRDPSAVIS